MSAYFTELARAEGLPPGTPSDFDESYFSHQLPGGMLTTMKRQLAEIRQLDKLPAAFEETARVRAELGYPIMVTPFSQVVATQAVMNVLSGERYANVPDEAMRYMLGRFGSPPGAVDETIKDRILSRPRAKELAQEPPMPEVAGITQTLRHVDLRRRVRAARDDAAGAGGRDARRTAARTRLRAANAADHDASCANSAAVPASVRSESRNQTSASN